MRDRAGSLPPSQVYYEHLLDLTDGPEDVARGFESSTRRALQKALRSGLEVRVGNAIRDVRDYYRLHCLTRRRHGLPPQPFSFFKNIHRFLLDDGRGFVVSALQAGTVISSALFLHFGKTAFYKFGASDPQFQELRANNLVMWEAIMRLATDGFEQLHFGRTHLDNTGLRRFKLGWGAAERELGYTSLDFSKSAFVARPTRESGWYNKIFHLMPVPFGRMVGAILYRHIG